MSRGRNADQKKVSHEESFEGDDIPNISRLKFRTDKKLSRKVVKEKDVQNKIIIKTNEVTVFINTIKNIVNGNLVLISLYLIFRFE